MNDTVHVQIEIIEFRSIGIRQCRVFVYRFTISIFILEWSLQRKQRKMLVDLLNFKTNIQYLPFSRHTQLSHSDIYAITIEKTLELPLHSLD